AALQASHSGGLGRRVAVWLFGNRRRRGRLVCGGAGQLRQRAGRAAGAAANGVSGLCLPGAGHLGGGRRARHYPQRSDGHRPAA
nr:hypothetical protein [Tanacetum cinerariifolium]